MTPRLYLVTPVLETPQPFLPRLEEALGAADIAAILLHLEEADERALINRVKAVAAVVQRRDIALLLDRRVGLVGRSGADGAHLTGIEPLRAALPTLKPDRIAGAGGLRSRDDAMLAGEAGADYVMFGEPAPDPAHRPDHGERGGGPPFAAVVERVAWWADLFQPPCIGYAANRGEVGPLAAAGADFIALGDWIWAESGGVGTAVTAANELLAGART
ncbi:MAG: thiamine phosphate synthase [Xanthobacteraceae bacterium]